MLELLLQIEEVSFSLLKIKAITSPSIDQLFVLSDPQFSKIEFSLDRARLGLVLRGINLKKDIPFFNSLINLDRDINHPTFYLTHNAHVIANNNDVTRGRGKDIEKQDQRDHAHHGDCEHNYLGDSCPRK